MSERKDFLAQVGQVSGITFLSRILGLVREMAAAHFLGTSFYADAFALAFSLPNLFRRLTAEGAMTNALIPVFCELDKTQGRNRALDFAKNFFWLSTLLLVVFCSLFIAFADFMVAEIFARGFSGEALSVTVLLTRVMFGYILLISLAAVAQGVLNGVGVFWVSSFTPLLLNLAMIGCAFLLTPLFANPAMPFALGVMLGGALQLGFQIPWMRRTGFVFFTGINLKDERIHEAMLLMAPALFGAGIYQINIILSNLIATTLSEGSLSSLTFSNRLLELILGVLVVSVTTVMLPSLSGRFLAGDLAQAKAMLQDNVKLISLVCLPVMAVTWVMAEEIVAFLFLRGRFDAQSLAMTAGALRLHILGLVFIGLNRVFLTAYQANKMIKITAWISFYVMLVNLGLAFGLAPVMGHRGIALANSASQAFQLMLLLWFLRRLGLTQVWDARLLSALFRQAALAMAVVGWMWFAKGQVLAWGLGKNASFGLLVAAAALSGLVLLPLLARPELAAFKRLAQRRAKPNPPES